MINLNRVDTDTVKIVVERTANSTVHHKEDPFVDRDGKHRPQERDRHEMLRQKVKQINHLFEDSQIQIYLKLRKFDIGSLLEVLVIDRASGQTIAVVDEEALDRIMKEIHSYVGIILDRKG